MLKPPSKPVRISIKVDGISVVLNTATDILISDKVLKYLHYVPGKTAGEARAVVYTLMEYEGRYIFKEICDNDS
ncbi:MAG: hypothetical protein QW292_08610, partial [Candidatus Parvarchaeota archaeon]